MNRAFYVKESCRLTSFLFLGFGQVCRRVLPRSLSFHYRVLIFIYIVNSFAAQDFFSTTFICTRSPAKSLSSSRLLPKIYLPMQWSWYANCRAGGNGHCAATRLHWYNYTCLFQAVGIQVYINAVNLLCPETVASNSKMAGKNRFNLFVWYKDGKIMPALQRRTGIFVKKKLTLVRANHPCRFCFPFPVHRQGFVEQLYNGGFIDLPASIKIL